MPSELDKALNEISDESAAAAKKELQDLLAAAKGDSTEFVQENARKLEDRLLLVSKGELDQEDFNFFLENQKRAAKIFVDSQPAQTQERAEKLTLSLLEMSASKIVPALLASI